MKAYHAAKKQAFQDAQQQPAGTPSPAATETPEARLTKLQTLHDRGVLTADEYAEQRHRILNQL